MLHALLVGTAHAELTHQQAKTCDNNGNHILELAPGANVDDVIAELNAKIASGAPAGRRLASVEGQVFGAKADRPTLVVSIPSASGKLSAFGNSKDAEDASNAKAKVLLESVKGVNFAEPDCLAHVQANTDHDEKVCSGSSPITRPWSLQATCCKNCGGTAQGCALNPAGSFDPANYNTIVFVLDTGVDHHHEAFKEYDGNGNYLYSRVIDVWNYIPSTPVQVPLTDPNSDGHSHGTHCAGSVAGNAVGVNHETAIVSQKVLSDSGSGSYSGILKAIEDVAEWMEPGGQYHGKNCVISMSLGGGTSSTISSQP